MVDGIDGQARIVVDVPGSAEVVLAVDDHDVFVAQAVELDRRADSTEARTDDDRIELLLTHKH